MFRVLSHFKHNLNCLTYAKNSLNIIQPKYISSSYDYMLDVNEQAFTGFV